MLKKVPRTSKFLASLFKTAKRQQSQELLKNSALIVRKFFRQRSYLKSSRKTWKYVNCFKYL